MLCFRQNKRTCSIILFVLTWWVGRDQSQPGSFSRERKEPGYEVEFNFAVVRYRSFDF